MVTSSHALQLSDPVQSRSLRQGLLKKKPIRDALRDESPMNLFEFVAVLVLIVPAVCLGHVLRTASFWRAMCTTHECRDKSAKQIWTTPCTLARRAEGRRLESTPGMAESGPGEIDSLPAAVRPSGCLASLRSLSARFAHLGSNCGVRNKFARNRELPARRYVFATLASAQRSFDTGDTELASTTLTFRTSDSRLLADGGRPER